MPAPLVVDIRRFSLDDGPGIRTTLFLKGCPLACTWCHNPESHRPGREMVLHPDRCVRCDDCRKVCPAAAITALPTLQIDRQRCTACGDCADACPAFAVRAIGTSYPVDVLLETLLQDREFYAASGGGVTVSGGEPTLWPGYLGELLPRLRSAGIHTAIQTCGMFYYPEFARNLLPYLDLIMFDLKLMDPTLHERYTGCGNGLILNNFRQLANEAGDRLLPRVPLVPGITATPDNLLAIAAFLAVLGRDRCDLLPYHPAGGDKRRAIGMDETGDLSAPSSPATENELQRLFMARLQKRSGSAA